MLAIAAELSTVVSIEVVTATCEDLADPRLADSCDTTGAERHSYALLLLGILGLLMTLGAAAGRSRPAAAALLVVGLVVLAIGLLTDLPATDDVGAVGANFSDAEAKPGLGFWFELAGGALMTAAGAIALRRGGAGGGGTEPREPPAAATG